MILLNHSLSCGEKRLGGEKREGGGKGGYLRFVLGWVHIAFSS